MKKLFLLIAVIPFLFAKCGDNKEVKPECNGVLNLNFFPIINNQPFIMNNVYVINGKKVRFSKFHFYSSSIVTSAGQTTCNTNDEVIFVDLTQLDDSTKSRKGFQTTLRNRASGSFNNIYLGLGVNPSLNGKTPQDFPSSNPLSKSDEYWAGWKSYVFLKLEGLMDKDGNGSFETGITYHTGSDDVGHTVIFPKIYSFDSSGGLINFDLNINKFLDGFDFNTVNKIENLSQKEDMKRLMVNLGNAMTVK
jgi:hypothetical protein